MKIKYLLNVLFFIVSINISVGQVPGNSLFDNTKIHEIRIVTLYENFRDTLEQNYLLSFGMNQFQIQDIPYAPAKLIVDDIVLDTLGIRYKGFNSWWSSIKKPIKIDINKYKSDQEYDGLKKFNLHNGSGDPSFIRENIDYKILRLLNIKAPRTSFVKVFVDTAYIGMYRIVEQIDNTFLDSNFGNHDGNLYKQQAVGTAGFSLQWLGNRQEDYFKFISLDNHENKNDWSGFIHFLDILNNTSDKQFRDSILTVFDVYEYLQVLAFDITVNNIDYYGFSGRNYYLYSHNGVFHWIPWDYNLTWRENAGPLNINPADFPVLTKRILQVPEFYDVFIQKYCQLKSCFSEAFIHKLISDETMAIGSYLKDDPYQDYPFEAFQKNTDTDWMRIPGLKPFAAQRYTDILKMLETLNVNCGTTGNEQIPDQNIFNLYPVPAKDFINIEHFPNQHVSVSIFNSYGQVVMNTGIFEKGELNISQFSSGCYIVKVNSGERVYSKLLLIQH